MQFLSISCENMRSFIVLLLIALVASEKRQISFQPYNHESCIADQDVVYAFRNSFDSFTVKMYRQISSRAQYTIILSPLIIWISLAAIAEGSDPHTRKEIFTVLNLPENACSRQKIYWIATTRLSSANHVNIFHTKALFIDQDVQVNPDWYNLVTQKSLLDIIPTPIRRDPARTSRIIKDFLSLKDYRPIIKGNAMLLNSIDYKGLWTNAFPDAIIKKAPFYSQTGKQIGSVDLMTVNRRVRIGYVSSMNSKIIELPLGNNGEYRMIFALVVDNDASVKPAVDTLRNSTLVEVLASLQVSDSPIKIAIPQFVISSEVDLKPIMEDMGIVNLWNSPEATRYISTPPAQLSSFLHCATMTLDGKGTQPPIVEYPLNPERMTHEDQYWMEFVADRPFMFGLFDAETYTCFLASCFSRPTYPN